jgi:hypothetical protein
LANSVSPADIGAAPLDTSVYLTAREADSIWADWNGDDSVADTPVNEDLTAAVNQIWLGPLGD